MAVDDEKNNENRKRKRGSTKRKLLLNQRVEVRSLEEGFLGSWHPGTVIRCGRQNRHVRYDNILDDNESNYLVDVLHVSNVMDGVGSPVADSDCGYERGVIRPMPPPIEFKEKDLQFAVCVDVSYQEAWWEGVIFDHCVGMEDRSIFFPELGDELKVGVRQLRITQDWDEATDKWKPRGKWVFLELFEEYERVSFVAVSVKQVWYDVRARKDFDQIRDWTCNVKDLWRDLVMEVIGDYFTLTLNEILPALNLPEDFFKLTPELGGSFGPIDDVHCDASLKENGGDSPNLLDSDQNCGGTGIIPIQEKCGTDPLVDGAFEKEIMLCEKPVSPIQEVLSEPQKEISCYDSGAVISDAGRCEKSRKRRHPTSIVWQPLVLSEVEFCPEVIDQYAAGCRSKKIRELLKTKVRKHLAYLGWKIEWTAHKHYPEQGRYRYMPPDKHDHKVYTSILQVIEHLKGDSNMNSELSQVDHSRMHSTIDNNLSHMLTDPPQMNQDSDVYPLIGELSPVEVEAKPEICPQAVANYYLHALQKNSADKRKWKLRAKNHLLAEGWIIDYPTEKRRTTLYKSPQNQCLGTLRGACRLYLKERIPEWTDSSRRSLNVSTINNEVNVDNVDSDDLLQTVSQLLQKEPELHTIDGSPASRSTGNRNLKRTRISKANPPKCQRNEVPTRVLRSSKTVQKVSADSCLSHQEPQNVLSWLIDCNIVLPRYKVYYWEEGGRNYPLVEGRITREGIKCNCCQEVFGIGGFANHASGSSNCRPSACIFLKDGRSLLDCMIQVMHDHRTREIMEEPCNDLFQGENDNICSICNYGGELLLCDQCPSSFHKQCLSLEDIPDGDWFCPSCRCGVCGQNKIEGTEDGHFLTCIQCEHKYHAGCLRNRANDNSGRYMENWFCREECARVYAGLQNMLGKSFLVGPDNLTWSLVKFANPANSDVGITKNDSQAECYSKLSVALSVMHECFEALKNPFSNGDIVEEVLFNSRSELNRLNFQGFYTILLERNEELISVATVRIFGDKVAELPLVGTRFKYRRHGMCRILMDELEKKLTELGVERLVLPAVPAVLDTWTNAFGFVQMTDDERSQFLDYAFLDFQGTVLCQKLLAPIPSPNSVVTRETLAKPPGFSVKCKIDFDKPSSSSEVDQAKGVKR